MTEVFVSATYRDQRDCIEEVKSRLAELGVKAWHFKEGHFYDGRIDRHAHDRCIEFVERVPNYIVVISFEAGNYYEGENDLYRGLTITHAEFRAAINAFNSKRRIYTFVRKDAWCFYNSWKIPVKSGSKPSSWDIHPNLFPLLEEIEKTIPYTDTFESSIDLKKLISDKKNYFV